MSDLHCPATILLVDLDDARLSSVPALDAAVASRPVTRVWCGTDPIDGGLGVRLADHLGVDVAQHSGLGAPGGPDQPQPPDTIQHLASVLREIADQHRGETVVVLSRSCGSLTAGRRGWAVLSVDSSGIGAAD